MGFSGGPSLTEQLPESPPNRYCTSQQSQPVTEIKKEMECERR
uniref:Uncharacterized protein n=1 Tax=Nelumbo nucifera TaxID=4432 RepID=A0A822Z347_NELNU|nr:TPA_asm: hypothetical protein HUJ06_013254 [Nelumbo nucifera]